MRDNAIEILHTLDIPIFRVSPEGLTEFLNINCTELYLADPIKIEGLHYSCWLDKETTELLNTFASEVSQEHNFREGRIEFSRSDSPSVYINWKVTAFYDMRGNRFFTKSMEGHH